MSFGVSLLKHVARVVAPTPSLIYEGYKYVDKKIDDYGREKYEQGVRIGTKNGSIQTAKKFADKLEYDDNLRAAALAIAVYVANLDGKINEDEVAVVESALGAADSQFVNDNLKVKFAKALDEVNSGMDFNVIKTKYLNLLALDDLQLLDGLVKEVIEADNDVSRQETAFLQNEWKMYLEKRGLEH